MEFSDFMGEFRQQLEVLPHHRLKEIGKELSRVREKRFQRHEGCKVEAVERGFTDEEFARFMAVVGDDQDKAIFTLMATLGLRVGELCALKGKDLEGDRLRVSGAKGGFSGYLKLPPPLLSIIPLTEPEAKLFPRHAEIRRRFDLYRSKAGLNDAYALSEPGGRNGTKRPLFRLSLHSLRHYAIQRVMKLTKDPDLARRFARHKKLDTTLRYLRKSRQEEIEGAIEALAIPQEPETIKMLNMR